VSQREMERRDPRRGLARGRSRPSGKRPAAERAGTARGGTVEWNCRVGGVFGTHLQNPVGSEDSTHPTRTTRTANLMPRAIWNGVVVAESPKTVVVEGNHYFPADAIKKQFFEPSPTQTNCRWKGTASHYTLNVGGQKTPDAAWSD